jgi:site-specific DNA recombinase
MTGGRRQKAKSGKVATGRIPFGYKKNEDGEMEIDPEEAKTVVQIFEFREEYGMSLREIATRLNMKGRTTKSGKEWSAASISYLLKNQKYRGELEQVVGGTTIHSTNESLKML